MASNKQNKSANDNIKKAQKKWHSMSSRQRALTQPEGRKREKPGEGGQGDWYRIVVRSKNNFKTFRYHDVGEKNGDVMRLAGKRSSGSWDTQAWLINKKSAHVNKNKLIPDTDDAKGVIESLGSEPILDKGDIFIAKARPNVAEKDKPTSSQKNAQKRNIKKAQSARISGIIGGKSSHKRK